MQIADIFEELGVKGYDELKNAEKTSLVTLYFCVKLGVCWLLCWAMRLARLAITPM
jgi:hypothetical protein